MLQQALTVDASEEILRALNEVGRIEDATFSRDDRRIALAAYHAECVLLLDVDIDRHHQPVRVSFTGATVVRSSRFRSPHGLAFVTTELLAVANRCGTVTLVAVPPATGGARSVSVEPLLELGALQPVESPGSVTAHEIAPQLYELLVCNNYVHRVTRHVVDVADATAPHVISESVLAERDLLVPDGVAVSADGRQLIVSNHDLRVASVFDNTPGLDTNTAPVGTLRGMSYPHGLQCTPDGRFALVADAGLPVVHVFASDAQGWSGDREPVASVRVVEEAAYLRSSDMAGEGGPKALCLDSAGSVLAVAGEHLPLSFFDVSSLTGVVAGPPAVDRDRGADAAARLGLLREAQLANTLAHERDQLSERLAEREAYVKVLEKMVRGLQRRVADAERQP